MPWWNPWRRRRLIPGRANRALNEWIDDQLLRAKLARQGEKIVTRWNAHIYSQNFEDSIIAEIVSRIGAGTRTFVEIGTESGEESNTRLLLQMGWRGSGSRVPPTTPLERGPFFLARSARGA